MGMFLEPYFLSAIAQRIEKEKRRKKIFNVLELKVVLL
jgi:hypothetical protein